jgi:hypothetical protein
LAKGHAHPLPAAGPETGDNTIVIRVKALKDVVQLRFGTHVARFKSVSADEMRAVAPRGSKTVAVVVTTAARASNETK